MSDKGTFPRQDTLGFCLLELAAICGEFPASLLPRSFFHPYAGNPGNARKSACGNWFPTRNVPKFSVTPVKNRGNAGPVPVIRRWFFGWQQQTPADRHGQLPSA